MKKTAFLLFFLFVSGIVFCQEPYLLNRSFDLYSKGKCNEILEQKNYISQLNENDKIIYSLLWLKSHQKLNQEFDLNDINIFLQDKTPLKNYFLFELAKYMDSKGEEEISLHYLKLIDENYFKDCHLLFDLLFFKSLIYEKNGNYEEEIKLLERISKDVKFDKNYRYLANLKKAKVYLFLGKNDKAEMILKEIAFDFSLNPYGSSAFQLLFKLKPDFLQDYSPVQLEELIKKLNEKGRQGDSYLIYSKFKTKIKDISLVSNILYKARKNDELFSLCDDIIKKEKVTLEESKALTDGLWATLRVNDGKRAKSYYEFLKKFLSPKSPLIYSYNYAYASFNFASGNFAEAIPLLRIVAESENSNFKRNAAFKLVLSYYLTGNYSESKKIALTLLAKEDSFSLKSAYFLKTFLGDNGNYSLPNKSIYAYDDTKIFQEKIKESYKKFEDSLFKGSYDKNSIAFKLFELSFFKYAINEIERGKKPLGKDDLFTLRGMLSKEGLFSMDFQGNFDEKIGFIFPLPYEEIFSEVAEKYQIEKSLVYAICRRESGFDPYAYSQAGAVGLFQIMPETAKNVSGKEISSYDLLDIEKNCEIACQYLKNLQTLLGDDIFVISAYNAGEDVTLRWKEKVKDKNLFLLFIPYFETQNYTENVLFDKIAFEAILNR